jgi:hypothetical protein
MRDHLLGYHEQFAPLGAPLRDPVIEIDDAKLAQVLFETRCFDPAPPTIGRAVAPAGDVRFRVGDRVRHTLVGCDGAISSIEPAEFGQLLVKWDDREEMHANPKNLELIAPEPPQVVRQPEQPEWIEWNGGECPVPPDTRVQIRFVNDFTADVRPAAQVWWGGGQFHSVVAYRVVS